MIRKIAQKVKPIYNIWVFFLYSMIKPSDISSLRFEDLTNEQLKQLVAQWDLNGCWWKGGIIKPPKRVFFNASCIKHDFGYFIWGDSKRRKHCDQRFYENMLLDCSLISSHRKKFIYLKCSAIYYRAVRSFWWRYFNYK